MNGFVRIKIRLLCDFVTEKIFQVGYTVIENKFREVKYGSINHYKNNFEAEVLRSDKPVLIDFWASWCGPCRMMSPIVDEIAAERGDIKVGKVNVDEESELAGAFNVMSIPTLVVIKEGKVVNGAVGVRPKAEILRMI